MRQYLRISPFVFRTQTCFLIFAVVFSCVIPSGQQEVEDPHSFTTLLHVLEDDDIRERRALKFEQDDVLDDGSAVLPNGTDLPVIVESEIKKFVVKKVSKVSVDVGSTVWAVRGTEITVSCRASSNFDSPKIEWLRRRLLITDRFRGGVAAIDGTLKIRRLTRFNEDTYTCKASNDAGETKALFTAKIIDPSLPTIITAEGDVSFGPNTKEAEITIGTDVTVYQGAKLTIRCPAEATIPVVVYWTARGRSAEIGKAVKVGQDLVITGIDQRYALEYKCNARSSRGRTHATSTVTVIALNPPKIQAGTKNLRVIEEENKEVEIYVGTKLTVISETQVTVRCVSEMEPSPAISWKIRGKNSGFKNGVTLSKDNSTLTISYPGVEDSGDYTCTASNNIGQDSKSSKIDILPPEPPTIRYSDRKITSLGPNEVIEATIGDELTLLAGASIVITCPTSGLPTPTVQWKKDDKDLAEFGRTLKINKVTTMDTGTFTCEALNRAGRISRISELTVIASEKPQIEKSTGQVTAIAIEEAVVKIGQNLRVVEGLIVRVVCPVRGFPTPEVSWFLNERMLKTSGRFLIDSRSSSLIVNGIQARDAGEISCMAESSAGQDRASTFVRIIGKSGAQIQSGNNSVKSIKGPREVSIQIGDSLQVLSGSDVSIDCLASGTPSPVINWRWNGRQVSSIGRFVIKDIVGGSRLIVRKLTPGSAGQYQCIAVNVGGSDRVGSTLTVIEALIPKIEVSSTSVEQIIDLSLVSITIGTRVTILPGAPLVITCRAFAIPEPTISWQRKGKKITSSKRLFMNSTTLVIRRTQRDDSGSFTCLAQNTIGKDSASSKLDFIEPISPRITPTGKDLKIEQLVRLSEAVGGSILCRDGIDLELTCSVQGLPTPKITWLRGSKKIGTGRKLSLGILKEESSGNYTCLATNIAGDARETTRLTVKSSIAPVIQSEDRILKSFEEGVSLTVTIGTRLQVIQGTRIDLICRVMGFPTPRVNWVKGNVRLDPRFEAQGISIIPYDGKVSTLLIRGSQPAQEDEVYGCTAYNVGGSVTAFSYVTFYERVLPSIKSTWVTGSVGDKVSLESRNPIKLVIGDSLRAFTKTKVIVECPVFAIPLADVEWTKDGGSLPSKHKVNGTNLVLSEDSETSDSGRYRCVATNLLGKDASYSDITLTEPTAPSIITSELSLELSNAVNYRATIGTNITTVLGNNITFVCVAQGVPSPTFSWWKGELDLNNTQTSHVVSASDTNATGVYSCRATNLAGSITTSSVVAVLDRIAPERATVPRIITTRENKEEFGNQRTVEHLVGGNVTILEGRNLLLRCPAEGLPQPSTSWLFNGIPVVVSDTLQIDQDTGDLKIIEMSQNDVGEYSCVATNIAGEAVESSYTTVLEPTFPKIDSSNISVEMFDPTRQPITVKIGSKVTTLTGTPVIITCDVSGFPDPKVAWVKGHNPITSSDTERLFVSENRISLLSSGVSDSGLYMCTASSPGGQAAAVSNITFVESVKPRILFATRERELLDRVSLKISIGEKLTVLDKSNITMECVATGAPRPTLTWSKDNIKLRNSQSSLLLLRNVDMEDAGRYTCTAENFLGFVSYSTVLSVRAGEKPLIRSKGRVVVVDDKITAITLEVGSNLTLVAGSTVTVACEVQGEPKPAIKWYQNGNHILSNVNKTSLSVGDPVRVNLQSVTCTSNNILGTASKSSHFTILEPSKPQIMVNEEKKVVEAQNRNSLVVIIGDDLIALTKTNITITCPTSGIPRPSITWTKDGRILRNTGRYQVQRDGSLLFHKADERDGARYTCNAVGVDGQDSASSIVQVVEPAEPRIQVPKRGQEIPIDDVSVVTMNIGDNVTAASNATITIRCPVSGTPTPTVTWQRDGVNIIGDDLISIADDNSLIMKQPIVQDSATYTCSAESEFGKDEVSSRVRIIELVRPKIDVPHKPQMKEAQDRSPFILNIGDNATALTKTSIVILCQASGVPTPTITWTKDGQKLSHYVGSGSMVQNDGSLRIVYSTEFDSGEYRCTATNIVGGEAMKSTVRIVEPRKPVIYVPKTGEDIPVGNGSPVLMDVGDNVTAASNTTITLRCPVSGIPTPSVTWKKNEVEIEEGRKTNIAVDNSLVLQSAEVQDSAKYTCSAQNKFGQDAVSSVVSIVGHSKPVIRISVAQKVIEAQDRSPIILTIGDNVTALTDSSVTLLCHVSGVPKPSVTWTKSGQVIATGGRYTVRNTGELLIVGVREDDEAQYKCIAVNVAGQDSEISYIYIVEPIKPIIEVPETRKEIPLGDGSPVTMDIGDNVTAASNTSITIWCPVSGTPTPVVIWHKDGAQVISRERINIVNGNTLIISGAELQDSAEYTCKVQNSFGEDDASSVVRIIEPSKPVIRISSELKMVEAKDRSPIVLEIGNNVTALTNTSITINCHASGVPTPTVTWTKDGLRIPSNEMYMVQADDSLLIRKLYEVGTTRYTCSAKSITGEVNISSAILIAEPSKPIIEVSEDGQNIPIGDGSPVTMNIGDNLSAVSNTTITIRCPVSGVPTPIVTWLKEGAPVIEGRDVFTTAGKSLVITRADSDDNGRYSCAASNVAGVDNSSSEIIIIGPAKPKVRIPAKPTTVELQDQKPVTIRIGDNVTALINTSITIQCHTSGVPTPTVTWTNNGQKIFNGYIYTLGTDNSLLIKNTKDTGMARYTCTAVSIIGKDSASSLVQIVGLSKPKVVVPAKPQAIEPHDRNPITFSVGNNVTALTNTRIAIQCHANGVPTPTITWSKDNQKIKSEDGNQVQQEDGSLLIKVVRKVDTAWYTCTAINAAGQDSASSTVEVVEPVKPLIIVPETGQVIPVGDGSPVVMNVGDNVTAASNTTITIRCPISGVPAPIVTWLKDDVPIVEGETFPITSDYRLVLKGLEAEHIAKYTCIAESEFGTDETSSIVRIIERSQPAIRIPSEPKMVEAKDRSPILLEIGYNVTALTNTSITINCHANGVPAPTVTWTKDGLRITSSEMYLVQADNSLLIRELYKVGTARYTCTAKSITGEVSASSTILIVEPLNPIIEVSEDGQNIPIRDGSPVTMNVGDNLTAASNTTITIRCPVSGVPTPTVTWLKEGAPIIEGRDVFTTDDKSLVITRPDSDDNGRYTCRAVNVAGMESSSSEISIIGPSKPKVKIPPKPKTVELQDQKPITIRIGDNVTALTNTNITIQCHASGIPTPSVTWTKDGQKIFNGDIHTIGTDNSLLIKNTKDTGRARYTCSAASVIGKDSASSTVQIVGLSEPKVDVPAKPKTIESHDRNPVTFSVGNNVTALANTSIVIQCHASGAPTPTLTWSKDNQEIKSEDGGYTVKEDGSLFIKVAEEVDISRYTCTATNVAGQDSASSTMEVVKPVKPTVTVPETGQVIPVGDGSPVTMNVGDNVTAASSTTITIRCPVSGIPTPTVTWEKNGLEVSLEDKLLMTSDNSLVIKEPTVDDSAKYTCRVKSEFGTDERYSSIRILEPIKPQINIRGDPKSVDAKNRNPITVNIGDNVTALTNTRILIHCDASGVPTPAITWTKDGQTTFSDQHYKVLDEGSLLIIQGVEESANRYTCTANSTSGQDSASSMVGIFVPTKPVFDVPETGREIPMGDGSPVVINVGDNVTAASNTTITIRCPVSGIPTPTVTWEKNGVLIFSEEDISVQKGNSLVLRGAEVGESGKYTCRVLSLAGMDKLSSEVTIVGHSKPKIKISDEPTTAESQDRNPLMIIIGDNVTALTNTNITIQCNASGVPTPTVTWTKDSYSISGGERYKIQGDGSLLITKTSKKYIARYNCIAESVAGKDSASSTLQIIEPTKPVINVHDVGRDIPMGDGSPVTMNVGDNVTAASNTTITIRCPVRGVPKPTVVWQRDGMLITEGGRFSIANDNTLDIKGAISQDSSKYTCIVQSEFGKDSTSSILQIIEQSKPTINIPNEPTTIEAQDFSSVTLTIGDNVTALASTNITIKCQASGAPIPLVTWSKDKKKLSNGDRHTVQVNGSLLLIIGSKIEDSARYTCTAESVAGKESASSTVQVVELRKPIIEVSGTGKEITVGDGSPVTMNIGDNVTAASNTTITIRCPVSGVPTPAVTWEKDGLTVTSGEKIVIVNENLLIIREAKGRFGGKYICNVKNGFGEKSLSSIIRILGPSKPKIMTPLTPKTIETQDRKPITIVIGDNVTALTSTNITIQCRASGVPAPTVTWSKDGKALYSKGRYTVKDDGSLVITGTGHENSSRYTCTADSTAGTESASSTVRIVDPRKPVIEINKTSQEIPVGDGSPVIINVSDNVTAALNTTITIRCPVSGIPTPAVTWEKDGVLIVEGGRFTFMPSNYSLVIRGAIVADIAKYTCRVQNFFGTHELSSTVTLIESVSPQITSSFGDVAWFSEKPVNITIGQLLVTLVDTELSIHCAVRGIPIPKVTWARGNQSLPSDGRMNVKNGTLLIVELETSDSGKYTCSAENPAGIASESSIVTVVVPTPPEIIRTGIKDLHFLEPKSEKAVVGSTILTISGNNLSLTCDVTGFPTPSIGWTKDGAVLGAYGSVLRLLSVEVGDTGVYTCTATSPIGQVDSQSTNLTVIGLQVPKIITNNANVELLKITNVSVTIGGKVTTLEKNNVSILCVVTGAPGPEITWEIDEVEVRKGGAFYTIESATPKDSGRYTCVAKNIGGKVKATTQLQVLAGKAPSIESLNRSLVHLRIDFFAITIGTNLTTLASSGLEISCPASGFPKPSIQWYREGVPVEPGMMLYVDEDTGTLFTLSISHRKGGRFSCKASNALGSVYASSFIAVLVPGAPQINVSRVTVQSLDSRDPAFITIGQTLYVLSGTNVSIKCPVSGIPEPIVTWSRQDKNLYTSGRVIVKDLILSIPRVTNADTGIYLCKAVNLAGDVTANSNVTVLGTSSPVISRFSQPLRILNSGSFTVDVGSTVTTVAGNGLFLRCNATGVPIPQIIWSKNSIPLNVEGSLYTLQSLTALDFGSYQCVASNIDGADKEDIQIIVLDGNAPKITSSEENIVAVSGEKQLKITIGGNVTTVIGIDIEILCPVMALPNPTITWLFNGSAIKEANPRFIKVEKTVLSLFGVSSEDIGCYTCHANNTFGKDTKTTLLSLIIPVEPKIMSSSKDLKDFKSVSHQLVIGDDLETLEGSTVYISCPTTGNPLPEIQWKTSGGLISSSERLRIVNSTLIILDGTWSDSGIYSCRATNGAGSDEMASQVNFMAPKRPSIRGDPIDIESFDRQPVTVAVGGTVKVLMKTTVNIQCVATGIPEPSFYWNSSSNDMQPANKFDVNQGGRLLTIHDVNPRDSGTYMCNAVNKAGEDSRAAVLEVIEPSLPKIATSDASVSWYNRKPRILPVGGRVEVLSGTEVTLTCKYSAFPEAVVKWIVLDVEGDPLPDVGYKVINGSLELMALQPSDSAQYVCSVENLAGTASASTILKVIDPQPPSISSSQDSVVSLSDRLPIEAIAGNVVTVLFGTNITVTCSADGVPTPSVAWSREEKLIPTTQSGILRIENSTAEDTGDYLCTAMSEVGVDQESTKITVIEPREPSIRPPEGDKIPLTNATLVKVTVGSDVTVLTLSRVNITCVVSGIPKPSITWLRDGEQLDTEEGSFLVLSIQDVRDAGKITCQAENMAGKAALSTIMNVIEPEIPRITSGTRTIDALNKRRAVTGFVGVTVKIFTATSLTLKCHTEGSPEPTVSWSKNGQLVESKGRISISDVGTITIKNTRTHDTGRYRCLARNTIGEASVASSIYVRAPMAPRITKSNAYIIWYESQPFKAKVGDNLTTLKGRRLTLTCPAIGVPKPAVSWYRGGIKMKSGKNYLVIGQTLIMYRLDPMDTDRYTCVARNFAGVKTATSTLKVHEPMAPDIMSSYGSAESLQDRRHFNFTIGTDVAVLQGSPMTIKCPVIGVPEPKIGWIKDGKMLSSSDRMVMDCLGTLKIYKLELEDSGDYVCSAQSFLGMDIAFSAVTVIEAVKPTVDISNRAYISSGELVDMLVGDNLTAILTTPVNINCTASGFPEPSMTWEMNGQQLGNGGNYNTDNNGALIIRGVQDPGEFTCVAQNFVGQDGASSFISLLDPKRPVINSSDEPKAIESMDQNPIAMTVGNNVTALTKTSVTIQCNASGIPPPVVTWTKDGQKISSGDKYSIHDNGSLFIREPDESGAAQYTCTAENDFGKVSASSSVQIVEPVKPVIEVQRPGRVIPVGDGSPVTINVGDNVTAPSNTTLTIRCPVSGIPKPVVSWERDGVQVTPEGRRSISSGNSLVIKGATVDDSANYKCSVQSIAGTDSVSSTVSIVEPSKPVVKIPDKPKTSEAQDKSPIIMNIGDNVTALTNTNITIQCHASGAPKPTITWLKDVQKIRIDGKYAIQDDGSLIIRGTDKGDTARYSCTAESATGKDSASSVVEVVEPKKPVIEGSETGEKIPIGDGSPVTLNVGDNVTAASNTSITIRCPVSGIPTPTVTWEKDGVEIIPGDDIKITRNNTLVIVAAKFEDNAQYTCRAHGLTGTDSASSTIKIVEPLRPTIESPDQPKTIESTDQSAIVMTVGDNVTALSNTNVTIQCNASGIPVPTVTWAKDDKKILGEDRYDVQDDGSLLIKDSNKEDTARYTCTVESVAGKESASSTVQIIDLKKPLILVPIPGPKISIGNGNPVITTVGSQITEIAFVEISLTCPTQGSPPPKVTWKKDGKELVSGNGYVIDDKGTLTVLEALTKDSGRYTCLAQNAAGKEEVTSPIDVLEPVEPIIVPSQGVDISDDHSQVTTGVGTKIDTINGTTVVITCNVKGVPRPTVSWFKDGQSISSHDRVVLASNGTLIIRHSTSEDSGNYTCTASSRSGNDSATSPVRVLVTRKPAIERSVEDVFWESYSPLMVAVGNKVEIISGSSVTLVCKSNGIPPPSLRWTRGIEASLVDEKYNIEEETLTISNIQIGDADNYTCTATNTAGKDAATTELLVLERGEPVILSNKTNLVDVNNNKPVVVSVGANMTTIINATVIMKCVTEGLPTPTITWNHNGRLLTTGDRYQANQTVLMIENVQLSDAGRYDCTATNRFGRDDESLLLTITVPPLISNVKGSFEITDIRELISITTGAVVTIPRGVAVRIKCLATGIPQPKITWYKRDQNHKERTPVVTNANLEILKDNSLSIKHTLVVNAAFYTCIATNVAGQDEGTTHLNIGTPPEVPSYWQGIKSRFNDRARHLKAVGASATIVKGATLNIRCAAVGTPKPTIKWIVATSGRQNRYTVLHDGTLEVPNADLTDEGNYTCIANNSYGTLNRTTTVSILVPPQILERHFRHLYDKKGIEGYAMAHMEVKGRTVSSLTVKQGYNLVLICTVSGKPKPHVTWTRNRVLIKNDTRHLLLPNGVLLVRRILVRESGQYKCVATNVVGKDQGTVQLTVRDQGKGYWKATEWSQCGNCESHRRGWQERHISCIGPGNVVASDVHCIHKPKPIKRRKCTHEDCEVMWSPSAWSACSRSCGLHGIKLRNAQCVFVKSLNPATGQCYWQEKPTLQESCNRKSCTKANCVDKVKYCEKVKIMRMCSVYSLWCCNTCHS